MDSILIVTCEHFIHWLKSSTTLIEDNYKRSKELLISFHLNIHPVQYFKIHKFKFLTPQGRGGGCGTPSYKLDR